MTNNEQPSPEQTSNGEMPEEIDPAFEAIIEWIKNNQEPKGLTPDELAWYKMGFHGAAQKVKRIYHKAKDQALEFDRRMKATEYELSVKSEQVDHLQKSIIQRDHEWKRIYDQLQESIKAETFNASLIDQLQGHLKMDNAKLQEKEKEGAEYRKGLEEIIRIGQYPSAEFAKEILDKHPQNNSNQQ